MASTPLQIWCHRAPTSLLSDFVSKDFEVANGASMVSYTDCTSYAVSVFDIIKGDFVPRARCNILGALDIPSLSIPNLLTLAIPSQGS